MRLFHGTHIRLRQRPLVQALRRGRRIFSRVEVRSFLRYSVPALRIDLRGNVAIKTPVQGDRRACASRKVCMMSFERSITLAPVRFSSLQQTVCKVGLPLVISIAFFLIAEIDSPRHGLIRVVPHNLVTLSQSLRAQ